jgi:hypothetical protein
MLPVDVFEEKRFELDTILTFGKYKLEDHLQLEHKDCGSIGHHGIWHGLRSCEEVKDHEGQCSDCLKFSECGKNLKPFLNTQ